MKTLLDQDIHDELFCVLGTYTYAYFIVIVCLYFYHTQTKFPFRKALSNLSLIANNSPGFLPGCPVPDIIILNSGLHDRYIEITQYKKSLRNALKMLKKVTHSFLCDVNKDDKLVLLLRLLKELERKEFPKNTRLLWKSMFVGKKDPGREKKVVQDEIAQVVKE